METEIKTEETEETEETGNMYLFDIHIINKQTNTIDKYSNTTSYDVPINHPYDDNNYIIKIYYKNNLICDSDNIKTYIDLDNETQEGTCKINYKIPIDTRHYIELSTIHFYFEIKKMYDECSIEEGSLKNIKFDVDNSTNIQRNDGFPNRCSAYGRIYEDEMTQDELIAVNTEKQAYKIYNVIYSPDKKYIIQICYNDKKDDNYHFIFETDIPQTTTKNELELLDKFCKIMVRYTLTIYCEDYGNEHADYNITGCDFPCFLSHRYSHKEYVEFHYNVIESVIKFYEEKNKEIIFK